jgi:hypothetical protein
VAVAALMFDAWWKVAVTAGCLSLVKTAVWPWVRETIESVTYE